MTLRESVPEPGDPATCMHRVVAYVAPYDPAFVQRIRGASLDAIQHYRALAGLDASPRSLPVSYRRYLEVMGLDDGGLFECFQIEADLPTTTRLYESCLRSEPGSLNRALPVVAVYTIGDQISFDLSTDVPEPSIVDTSDGEAMRFRARSWETLVMQAAMFRVEPRRLAHGRSFSLSPRRALEVLPRDSAGDQSAAKTVDAWMASLDLTAAWPGDARVRIGTSERFSAFAELDDGNRMLLSTFSSDEALLERVTADFAARLGARIVHVLRRVDGASESKRPSTRG